MNNGANIQIALKSGTNQLHAAFFEFMRNDAADARDYFLNFPASRRLGATVEEPAAPQPVRSVAGRPGYDFSALLTPLIRNGVPVRAPTIVYDPLTGEPFRDSAGTSLTPCPPAASTRMPRTSSISISHCLCSLRRLCRMSTSFARFPIFFIRTSISPSSITSSAARIRSSNALSRCMEYRINDINPNFPSTQRIQY